MYEAKMETVEQTVLFFLNFQIRGGCSLCLKAFIVCKWLALSEESILMGIFVHFLNCGHVEFSNNAFGHACP